MEESRARTWLVNKVEHCSNLALLWVIDEMAAMLEVNREQSFHADANVLCSSRDSHWQAT